MILLYKMLTYGLLASDQIYMTKAKITQQGNLVGYFQLSRVLTVGVGEHNSGGGGRCGYNGGIIFFHSLSLLLVGVVRLMLAIRWCMFLHYRRDNPKVFGWTGATLALDSNVRSPCLCLAILGCKTFA